ncbi:MAG: 4Fe-4S dicluster domain-containing protein [Steroidobacteraceae bacterium]
MAANDIREQPNRVPKAEPALQWRGLEELQAHTAAAGAPRREQPVSPPDVATLDRRQFLRLTAASLSLAGAGACSRAPQQTIVPYVHAPPQLVAGDPLYFATAAALGGAAQGLLVKSNYGRPTKIEGNPAHPGSLGATDIFAQAAVLDLWDPDRAQAVLHRGQESTWESFVAALSARLSRFSVNAGDGLRILTESVTSPTLAGQLQALLERFPGARWHQYQPINGDRAYEGSRLAFGEALEARYQFDEARVVLSLDSDFLGAPGVRYARDYVSARRTGGSEPNPGRLYVVECTPTLTGSFADHRYAVRFAEIEPIARALAQALGVAVAGTQDAAPLPGGALAACARDLKLNAGRALVVVGDAQPPIVHALAHAINETLGNVGRTVSYTAPILALAESQDESLRMLAEDMAAGHVDTLIMLGGNPVYNAPADRLFGERMPKVGLSVHLSLYDDETSALCDWQIPQAHFLESWSDTRAFDGTAAIQQPLIAPLYGGKSAHELLTLLLGQSSSNDYQAVRDFWTKSRAAADAGAFWDQALHRGVFEGSQLPVRPAAIRADFLRAPAPTAMAAPAAKPAPAPAAATADDTALDLIFAPDPTVWDGRFANNAWLQELPKPLTKLTWDNAALVGPALAERLGLANEDQIELQYRDAVVLAPVWIIPGQPDATVTVTLGYGRKRAGRIGDGVGFNAYALRQSDGPWHAHGLQIRKTGAKVNLATTQHHFSMEGRRPVRSTTLAQYRTDPTLATADENRPNPSMYEPVRGDGYAWAMNINLDACIGCNACTIACQAENNIPVVGKKEVLRGREMHWIRVDRYYEGEAEQPRTHFQPVPCMHCEQAPCEVVCPVEATVHDSEGLNLQVYNRCIGTRFCSNNCPYKVRRFNFLQYSDENTESLKAQRNPEVTVRMRGVMEKCTYCVQRITDARIEAEKGNRRLTDGEVVTACQAACPTGAIVFGDLNDPGSRVRQVKASPLDYALLSELNTRPRTTYLAKLSNPNPELIGTPAAKPAGGG